jgi:arylesterase / paraoxonase
MGVSLPVAIHNSSTCRPLAVDLEGCENGQLHESSGLIFYAVTYMVTQCAEATEKRRKDWAATKKYDDSIAHYGHLAVIDSKTDVLTKLVFPVPVFEFSSHGMGIVENPQDKNEIWIAAVNHKKNDSVIERFEYTIGSGASGLKHTKTIYNQELLHSPNDVAPVGRFSTRLMTTGLVVA